MADLNVNFLHPTSIGRIAVVTVDDGITASEAIKELIGSNFITQSRQGYSLARKEGIPIQVNQTFLEADIRENDQIRIIHQVIPEIGNEVFKIRINHNTKVTILLGAGASEPSGIPTVNKLLSELWKSAKKLGRDDLDLLAAWCNEKGIVNIEDLLTAAHIANFAAKNENVSSLLDYFLFARRGENSNDVMHSGQLRKDIRQLDISSMSFLQDTLQTLFGLLTRKMISASPNPAHNAIVNFLKRHKNTTIITTNYDGCMEEAMARAKISHGWINSGHSKGNNNTYTPTIIKMHGAINWSYCDSCQNVHEADLLELKKAYNADKFSYSVIGVCKCGGSRRPLLVPPLSFKFLVFPNLIEIWNSARRALEEAEYVIVVGYSFSESDIYITKIISRSISKNKSQKILIIDVNQNVASALRDKFSVHIENFDRSRVIDACESCEKILPKILESLLHDSQFKNKTNIAKKRKA